MPLFLADIHLHRAPPFLPRAIPWESPQVDLAEAPRLIKRHGYWRQKGRVRRRRRRDEKLPTSDFTGSLQEVTYARPKHFHQLQPQGRGLEGSLVNAPYPARSGWPRRGLE